MFAAPPVDYVLETSKLLRSEKGVLHIVNNYTGDGMAFDMGASWLKSKASVATIVVNDDVAVQDSTYTIGGGGWRGTSSSSRR